MLWTALDASVRISSNSVASQSKRPEFLLSRWCLYRNPWRMYITSNNGCNLWSSKFNSSRMSLVLGLFWVFIMPISASKLLSHFEGWVPAHSPSLFCGIFFKKGRKCQGVVHAHSILTFLAYYSVPPSFPTVMIWMNSWKFHPCLVQISISWNVQQFAWAFFKEPLTWKFQEI